MMTKIVCVFMNNCDQTVHETESDELSVSMVKQRDIPVIASAPPESETPKVYKEDGVMQGKSKVNLYSFVVDASEKFVAGTSEKIKKIMNSKKTQQEGILKKEDVKQLTIPQVNIDIATWVLKAVRGDCESSRGHVVIKSSTYERVWKEFDQDEGMVIVGWYHSHPNMGIFTSETDKRNAKLYHYKPYQITIVIDPMQNLCGTFAWQNEDLKCLRNRSIVFNGDYKKYFHENYSDKFPWENKNIVLERVYISKEAIDTMEEHTRQSVPNEVGGLLIGKPSIIKNE